MARKWTDTQFRRVLGLGPHLGWVEGQVKTALKQWESLLAFVLRACELPHLPRRFWPFSGISSTRGLHTPGESWQVHASPFTDEGSELEANQLPHIRRMRAFHAGFSALLH